MEVNNPRINLGKAMQEDLGSLVERCMDFGFEVNEAAADVSAEDELPWFNLKPAGLFRRHIVCPMFGGNTSGLEAEVVHTVNKDLSLICARAFIPQPTVSWQVEMER